MEKEKLNLCEFTLTLFIDISNEIMDGFKEITKNLYYGFERENK